MDQIKEWRTWFLNQFGEVRDTFKEFDEACLPLMSIFLSTYFKPGFDPYAGGIFIDMGIDIETNQVKIVGASFSKNSAALYVSRSLVLFSSNGNTVQLTGEENRLSESVRGVIKYKIVDDKFVLKEIDIDLLFWNQRSESYNPVRNWNTEEYLSNDFEVLCSNCFGEGLRKGMSIPKADYESGLSGYALYSCNTINGTYGCKACGGKGAKYENWYLDENPDLKKVIEPFQKGWGSIQQTNRTEAVCKELTKQST